MQNAQRPWPSSTWIVTGGQIFRARIGKRGGLLFPRSRRIARACLPPPYDPTPRLTRAPWRIAK